MSKHHTDDNNTLIPSAPKNQAFTLKRRDAILMGAAGLLIASCGGGGGSKSTTTSSTTTSDNSSSGTTTTTNESDWLSGGTSAMQATFPPASDPFASGLGNLCTLTSAYTIGPCYFDVSDTRDDISEGELGVPMTLALKLVDASCQPIQGGIIEVWWVNADGVYSGDNSDSTTNISNFNASYCTGNAADALAARWFRGIKTTDSSGNVYFKACFPGWYRGRTTHIHVRVVYNNTQYIISQFCFDDDLCNEIYVNHSDYTGTAKDTSNDSDGIFSSNYESYMFAIERQWDGSMLAYKAIQINA